MAASTTDRDDSLVSTIGCLLAAVCLGWTLQRSNGTLDAQALNRLTATIVLALAAVLAPRLVGSESRRNAGGSAAPGSPSRSAWLGWSAVPSWEVWNPLRVPSQRPFSLALPPLLVLVLGFQFAQFLLKTPAGFLQLDEEGMTSFHQLLALAAVTGGVCVSERSWLRHAFLALLLWCHLKMGLWILAHTQDPYIDVHVFQRDSVLALLSGRNPYAIDFPNLYGDGTPFYGAGLTAGGRVLFGYIYPPINLLLAVPGHLLANDHRTSQLVAMTATGALFAYMRPGTLGTVCAALYLFTPRSFYVLERGWTEPFGVLLLAATVFCACHLPRVLPYLFGLFLSAKQYFVLVLPLYALLLHPGWSGGLRSLRELGGLVVRIAALPVALILPFVLWNPRAFYHSAIELQFLQPFRKDALSYSAWLVKQGGEALPVWLGFALALVIAALVLWRAPRTPGGFAAGVGLVMLAFFSVNKQAFCNYYFLVLGAFTCAAAASYPVALREPIAEPAPVPVPIPPPGVTPDPQTASWSPSTS